MEKYLAVISNSIKKNLAYRVNNFIMLFSVLFSFGVVFFLWNTIYRQGNQIGTYTLKEIISYFVFVTIFEMIFSANTAYGIGEEIKNGQIINSILKPIKYLEYKLSQSLGSLLYRFTFFSPIIILLLFLTRNFLAHPKDSFGYEYFIILSSIGYILNFFIFYVVGILAFWVDDSYGLYYALLVVVGFMQGGWLPLDLLPKWIVMAGEYLPFKYLFFVPVQIASGRSAFNFSMVIIPLLWCIIFYFLAQFLFKEGIKKYEGYGV